MVWHSSLTVKNRIALERVQKAAVRVIMGKKYLSYKNGLKNLNLENLTDRREKLCLKFAKNCLKNEKVRNMFPKNITKHTMKKRKTQRFKTRLAKTKRFKKSAIPYMVRLLNKDYENRKLKMN